MSTQLVSARFPRPSPSRDERARGLELEFAKESKKEDSDVPIDVSEIIPVTIQISATAPIDFSPIRVPIRVEGERLIIDADAMQPEVFYPIEYEGIKQLVKKTKDGKIEFYEVVQEND